MEYKQRPKVMSLSFALSSKRRLQTTAKKLKFKLIIPELVVLILQAKPLEKKKNQKRQVTFSGFVLFKVHNVVV